MGLCAATERRGTSAARRARPVPRLCLLAAAAVLVSLAPRPAAAGGAIYVSAGQAGSLAPLSANFRQELARTFYFPFATADSERAVMQRIAARPGDIGLAERDAYLQYRRDDPKGAAALEFYAYVPACLVAVVRGPSPLRNFGDLVRPRADRPLTLDIGPGSGVVAASYANIRRLDAALGNLTLEHRGGSLALERVAGGATDAALRFVTPPFVDGELEELRQGGKIRLLPFASNEIARAAARGRLPYAQRRIELPQTGWFAGERTVEATCTELGVVVNGRADPSLTEAIAGVTLRQARAAGERPWYRPLEAAVVAMLQGFDTLARNAAATLTAWLGWTPGPASGVALVRDPPAGR